MEIRITLINKLPAEFEKLINDSKAEGHTFIEKTKQEWVAKKNDFSKEGEKFFLVYNGDNIIGCGGVNIDPYTENKEIGRIRHLYISPDYRRNGIARKLLNTIIVESNDFFKVLRLRANSLDLGSYHFYRACGFKDSSGDEFETHRMIL